jgi:hypothetical protein
MIGPHSYQPPEDGRPPHEVKIQGLRAEPWSEDGRRLRIHLDVTPFLERPNIEVSIANENGDALSSVSIIESIDAHMAFTMHLRGVDTKGKFILSASISYPEIGDVDQKSVNFET